MTLNILVAQQPGDGFSAAAIRARELAQAFPEPVNVRLCSVIFDSHIADHRVGDTAPVVQIKAAMTASEQAKLLSIAGDLAVHCERVDTNIRWGSPVAEELTRAAREFHADLVIATLREHSRLARVAFSHADWELARLCSVPVLFARPEAFRPYKSVVTAVDPVHAFDGLAALDSQMICAGGQLAAAYNGQQVLVNAYPDAGLCVMAGYAPPPEVYIGWKRAHKLAVAKLADKHGIDAAHIRLIKGDPKHVITDAVDSLAADLVVVGSVSRRHKRRVVGQNSGYVMAQANCDVLVVRAEPVGKLVRSS